MTIEVMETIKFGADATTPGSVLSQQWQVRDTRDNRLVGNFDCYRDAQGEADRLNHLAYMSRDTRYIAVTADLAR